MNAARLAMPVKCHRPGIAWAVLTLLWLWLGAATAAQAGGISGTVGAAGGGPLSGISLFASAWNPGGNFWQPVAPGNTAANGTYTITGLAAGTYRVCFSDPALGAYAFQCYSNAGSPDAGADVPVTATGMASSINVQLAPAGRVTGKVSNAAGLVAGIQVQGQSWVPSRGYWQWWGSSTFTAADGTYTLGGMGTGLYRICFSDPNVVFQCYNNAPDQGSALDVSVIAGQTVPNVNAQLVPAAHITGTVTDASPVPVSLAGIQVQVNTWNASQNHWQSGNSTPTAANGSYDLGGLAAATYRVCFNDPNGVYAPECFDNVSNVSGANDLPVAAGQTVSGINAQLALAGHVTGTVTYAASPVAGITVQAQAWNPGNRSWDWMGNAFTASNGSYNLTLGAGTYKICFGNWSSASLYATQCYINSPNQNGGIDVVVGAGQTVPNINAQLALAGHVTGTVTDATGAVAGITVQAQAWNAGNRSWDWRGNTFTASNGGYNLALGAGTYKICFGNGNGSGLYAFQCYNNAPNQSSGADVRVNGGQTVATINARLARAGHITGAVTDAHGGLAAGIQVQAQTWNAAGNYWQWAANTTTGPAGTYDLGGLSAGNYQVCFYGWNPNVQQCNTGSTGIYIAHVTLAAGQTVGGINAVAVDIPPPTVISLQPADGAAGVPVHQPIVMHFSRSMQPSCQVQLMEQFGGADSAGQTTWSRTTYPNDTLTFVPSLPLRNSMSYDLSVSQCRDPNGIWLDGYQRDFITLFSTAGATADLSLPRVTSTAPFAGQSGGNTAGIGILFDKPIAPLTVNLLSALLSGPGFPPYRLQPQGSLLNIWPQGLQAQGQYQVTLTTAVADAQGHTLAAPYSFSFNTGAGDTTAPTVVQTLPADLSPGLEWEAIRVNFSENMDPHTILPTTVRVFDETAGNTQVGIHIYKNWVGEDGARAQIEIDRAFAEGGHWQAGHTYRVELAASIADLAGNPLGTARVFRFTAVNNGSGSLGVPPNLGYAGAVGYLEPGGRVSVEFQVHASSNTGGSLTVSVDDLTQGKSWNIPQSGMSHLYTTPPGADEALVAGTHQLRYTVTDPSNGQTRTWLGSNYVFGAVPVLTGGPADGATGVALRPTFSFGTTGVTGAAVYMLSVWDAVSNRTVYQTPIFPSGGTSYSIQVPASQALLPNTAYRWKVYASDSASARGGATWSLERHFTTGGTSPNYTLTVAKTGTGSGTVGGGGSYAANTPVTPTATAATGSTFTRWNPASCGSTFALTANITCTATFTLNQVLTTTTVGSSLNPSSFGQPVAFTATVTPAAATGSVTFKDGATILGTRALAIGGTATLSSTALTVGSHSITAVVTGTGVYVGSTSPALSQTVDKVSTATAVVSSLSPSTFGRVVKFTATVTPATATGTVTFKDGATTLGTGVLAGGVASFSTAGLVVGGHSITAVLTGTGVYAGSTSVAITQTVNPVSTTTTVGSSLNPATAGQVVRFTATVTPAAATGTATFMEGATTLGTGTRVGGIATFSTTTLAVGTHGITAVFNPTGGYTGSTSAPLTQTIKGNTVTTLATDRTPAIFGQTVTFTATVTPSAVTGAVTFKDGARILGTGTLSPAGIAIFTTAALTVGSHSITAVTAGDSIHNPSTSRVLVQTVTKVPTTTTVSSSRNPSTVGGAVAFTATVSPATATGIVTFKNGAAILGTGTLAGGTATFSNSALTVGSHSITAVLTGTGVFAGSTSPALSQTVDKVPTTTTVASSLNPSLVRQIVRFTATVTPARRPAP